MGRPPRPLVLTMPWARLPGGGGLTVLEGGQGLGMQHRSVVGELEALGTCFLPSHSWHLPLKLGSQ